MARKTESEWRTREQRIDPKLDAPGWKLARTGTSLARRTEEDTANGPADYALRLDDQVIGVVEAKNVTIGPRNVLAQARQYARGVATATFNYDGLHYPFPYSTSRAGCCYGSAVSAPGAGHGRGRQHMQRGVRWRTVCRRPTRRASAGRSRADVELRRSRRFPPRVLASQIALLMGDIDT